MSKKTFFTKKLEVSSVLWRKLFKPLGAKVVYTVDYDGEVRFRFAKKLSDDKWICRGIGESVILYEDKTVSRSFIYRWEWV